MARLAAALAALLALASPARAQTRPAPDAPPPASAPAPMSPSAPREGPAKAAAEPAPSQPLPRGAVLEEVAGTIHQVDLHEHRLSLDTASGPVTLSLDRNTMVYTIAGLGTVLDLADGAQVRAGRNADFLAYWVQVRAAATAKAQPTPNQGTGPGGASGPPPSESQGTGTPVPAPVGPAGAPPASGPKPGP